jgi:hypothetical protein
VTWLQGSPCLLGEPCVNLKGCDGALWSDQFREDCAVIAGSAAEMQDVLGQGQVHLIKERGPQTRLPVVDTAVLRRGRSARHGRRGAGPHLRCSSIVLCSSRFEFAMGQLQGIARAVLLQRPSPPPMSVCAPQSTAPQQSLAVPFRLRGSSRVQSMCSSPEFPEPDGCGSCVVGGMLGITVTDSNLTRTIDRCNVLASLGRYR